ncbi:hypothetical protein J1605_020783 [Eschrichtius robustus]|uniref:Eukaryotic translation initiation factor 4B n=1 Tax=Eschrichtius robustus TaxID=9764 RepID=A0AB34HIT0_ESCRO|nr:hypothetical protein J1605_020783 [Eschrichtius robustus]
MEDSQKHSPGGRAGLLSRNQRLQLAQQSAHATPSRQLQGWMGLFPNLGESRDDKGGQEPKIPLAVGVQWPPLATSAEMSSASGTRGGTPDTQGALTAWLGPQPQRPLSPQSSSAVLPAAGTASRVYGRISSLSIRTLLSPTVGILHQKEKTLLLSSEGSGPAGPVSTFRGPAADRSILPTAPRAAREPNIDWSRLPKLPPYTAFLGNLPYDVTEDSIKEFFRGLNISAVCLLGEPSNPERLKSFGYAEFEDLDSLLSALSLSEEFLGNRRIRVDVADQAQGKDRDDRSFGRDRNQDSEKTDTDWRPVVLQL